MKIQVYRINSNNFKVLVEFHIFAKLGQLKTILMLLKAIFTTIFTICNFSKYKDIKLM